MCGCWRQRTNSLKKESKRGRFAQDLLLPAECDSHSLAEPERAPEDIPLLVAHFLKGKATPPTHRPFQLTCQTMEVLCAMIGRGTSGELETQWNEPRRCARRDNPGSDLPPNISAGAKGVSADGGATAPLPEVPESALYPLHGNNGGPPSTAREGSVPLNEVASLKNYLRDQERTSFG